MILSTLRQGRAVLPICDLEIASQINRNTCFTDHYSSKTANKLIKQHLNASVSEMDVDN